MIAGDAGACKAALDRFRASVQRKPLDEAERETCGTQLQRLRVISAAACEGVQSARAWLAELVEATGRLEVYDRGGRQQVSTALDSSARRY